MSLVSIKKNYYGDDEMKDYVDDEMKDYVDDKYFLKQIMNIKKDLGEKLIILTHHYQHKDIVDIPLYRFPNRLSQPAHTFMIKEPFSSCGS